MQTIYHRLLKTWCDGMLDRQVTQIHDPSLHGALLCPACVTIHGRCADAVPPLLHQARLSGESRYVDAAIQLQTWVENVTKPDGSWMNDVKRGWQGITVFGAMALHEAIHDYGDMVDAAVRARWTERLRRATQWIYNNIRDVDYSNINYPVSAAAAMAVTGKFFDDKSYLQRARDLARSSVEFITDSGLIVGEGQPLREPTVKGCRPIDICYNVEETIGAFAIYALEMQDEEVLQAAVTSLRGHLAFMLPDGGWDASWCTRNFKWSYWGSRTSDGMQVACALLADHDPLFVEAGYRNAELYERCTHDGLLYGGPDLHYHKYPPCIHHTFCHAKSISTAAGRLPEPTQRMALPIENAPPHRRWPEVATSQVAMGPWRATVTDFDLVYQDVPSGHVTGGTLSLLHHARIGAVLTASMIEYHYKEPHNMQPHKELGQHLTMPLTPRIETRIGRTTYSSVTDRQARVQVQESPGQVTITAAGKLLDIHQNDLPGGPVGYKASYRFTESGVAIEVQVDGVSESGIDLILPVISRDEEPVSVSDGAVQIRRPGGTLNVKFSSPAQLNPQERVLNLVPGFAALAMRWPMQANQPLTIEISADA